MAKIFTPSVQQQALFDQIDDPNGGNIIVDAKAGCGKSTSLAHAAKRMHGKVFYGVFNTKNAKEMRARPELQGLTNVYVKTFHAAGFSALQFAFKGRIKGDPDARKVRNIVDNAIDAMTPNDRAYYGPLADAIIDCVSMAKQRGIGALPEFPDRIDVWEDMIEHFDLLDKLPEDMDQDPVMVGKLIACASKVLRRSNDMLEVIDFDDMVYLPLVYKLRMLQHDWVLIDEAQDTNPTRRALAERLLRPGGRLIAVGDPNQAIYGFSGADNDSLDQIRRRFNAKVLPLSVTYRCPKTVVAVAQQWVHDIEAHESAPQGEFREVPYADIMEAVKPGDAILCRYNKYLVNLCFKFIRNGIPAKIEGRAIGQGLVVLAKKWKSRSLTELQGRVTKYMEREIKKAQDAGKDNKADQIADKCETMLVLIERGQEQGITTVPDLVNMIMSLFDDQVVDNKNMITLCSAHRSKGLEFPRVFVLGLYELMGRECKQAWQTQQEINLQYVAATRAQELLVDVTGVREERKQREEV